MLIRAFCDEESIVVFEALLREVSHEANVVYVGANPQCGLLSSDLTRNCSTGASMNDARLCSLTNCAFHPEI